MKNRPSPSPSIQGTGLISDGVSCGEIYEPMGTLAFSAGQNYFRNFSFYRNNGLNLKLSHL
jgi:hypothetical protein